MRKSSKDLTLGSIFERRKLAFYLKRIVQSFASENVPKYCPWKDISRHLTQCDPTSENERQARRLRTLLGSLIVVFKIWRSDLLDEYGSAACERAAEILSNDGRSRAWLRFLEELSAAHRQDAIDALILVKTEGFAWSLPGGKPTSSKQDDFGVQQLHLIATRLELELNHSSKIQSVTPIEVEPSSAVMQLIPNGNSLKLKWGKRSGTIQGQAKDLVLYLYAAHDPVPFVTIYNHIWGNTQYLSERGGPPAKLRDLSRRTRRQLAEQIGSPPSRVWWVLTKRGFGLELNRAVTWRLTQDRTWYRDPCIDPVVLSRTLS